MILCMPACTQFIFGRTHARNSSTPLSVSMPSESPPESTVPSLKRECPPYTHSLEERHRKSQRQPDFDKLPKLEKGPKQGSMPAAGPSRATEPRLGCVAVRSVPPPSRVSPRDQALACLAAMQKKYGGDLKPLKQKEIDIRRGVLRFVQEVRQRPRLLIRVPRMPAPPFLRARVRARVLCANHTPTSPQVVRTFDLPMETGEETQKFCGLAMTYFDTYLSKAKEPRRKKALEDNDSILNLASVCISLVSKFMLTKSLSHDDLGTVAWDCFRRDTAKRPRVQKTELKKDQKDLEIEVLKTLEWKLAVVSPCDALPQIFKALELHKREPIFCEEIAQHAHSNLFLSVQYEEVAHKFAPVTIAASSLIAACNNLGHHQLWNNNFERLRDIWTICEISNSDLEKCARYFPGPILRYQPDKTEDLLNTPLAPGTVANAGKTGRPTNRMPPLLAPPFMEEESDVDEWEEEDEMQRDINVEIELEADDESLDFDMDTSDEDEVTPSW